MPKGAYLRESAEKRFWSKVKKYKSCWNWTGHKNKEGYGRFRVNGKIRNAHRVAWEMAHGKVPKGRIVCHHCDNTSCVYGKHLFLGTHKTNAADRESKARGNQPRGERNGNAKLTEKKVIQVFELRKAGTLTLAEIGKRVGINRSHVSRILSRTVWNHLSHAAWRKNHG